MKIISIPFFITLCIQANAFDFEKLGFTAEAQLIWKVNGFNDAKRMYSFRPTTDGSERALSSFECYGMSYTHITGGSIQLTPAIKFGLLDQEGIQSKWLGLDFTLVKYHFQNCARYINISIQKDLSGTIGTSSSVSLGILKKIWEKPWPCSDANHLRLGLGLSAMRFNGITSCGIQFKFHWWRFRFYSPK